MAYDGDRHEQAALATTALAPPAPAPWAALGPVTVIVPAFDERATIGAVVAEVRQIDPRLDLLVVDDGSRDGTARLALAAGARVLTHARRRGNGAAVKSGLAATDNPVVVVLDGDGQHDPADIPRLLGALLAGADLAVGSRKDFVASGPLRRLGNRLLACLASALAGQPLPDLTSGLRAFRVAAVRPLLPRLPDGFATPTTMTLGLLAAGADVRFLPVTARPRKAPGKTRTRLLRDGLAIALRATLGHRPERTLRRLLVAPVVIACVVALALGLGPLGTALLALVVAPLVGLAVALVHGRRMLTITALLLCGLLARGATAQDPPASGSQEPPASEEALREAEAFAVPAETSAALEVDPASLRETLAAATIDKLAAVLDDWMALVAAQDRLYQEAAAAPEGSEQHAGADALGTDRDALIARAEVVIELLVEQGGDVAAARAAIQAIRDTEAERITGELSSTVPSDQTSAQSVDLEVLRAQLRPLRVDQVAVELAAWMGLLQTKCLEVRKAEVAGLRAEAGDEITKYNAAAVALRAERDALIQRVDAVIDALEAKGGDAAAVAEHRAYVASVVVSPRVSGFRATTTRFTAWLVNPEGGVALGLTIARFLAIVVGFKLLSAVLSGLLDRTLRAVGRTPELLRDFFVNALRNLTMVVGLVVALGQVGVDIGPLVAAIGGAAFVIGFALQGTLSNFAAGLMILMYRPYNVGDLVEIGGTLGTVDGQNLVSTTIKTLDNKVTIVPNSMIWGGIITNATASTTRRVDMLFGIGYGDDIGKAERILRDVVKTHDRVLADPEPVVQVHELGESSVNFVVRPWVRTEDYWTVYWDVTRAVKERFDAEGVSIPFPQRDVHVFQESPARDVAARPPGRATTTSAG